jgi:hypothetical protein
LHDGDDVHSKSTTDNCRQTQESTDHLDRKAGSLGASRTTALFSFEGTNLALVRRFGVRLTVSSFSKGHLAVLCFNKAGDGEFLENCIEKNFHVSQNTHESGHQTSVFDGAILR